MQVRQGYKQTEVGVIPEDWEAGNMDSMVEKVGSGITPTGGERVYKKEGRPFIRSQNVGWGKLILDDIAFIDEVTHESFQSTEIVVDDVFLNITGASIGRSAVADNRVAGGNVNQHVCIIRTNKGKLHPFFLNHFLLSKSGQRQIDNFQSGGNRQGLNFGQIRTFQLPTPPLTEQKLIAIALSDADALIASLDKLIAKKRDIKQATMQQLLTGKTRLPGFSGEWEVKRLGDVAAMGSGGTPISSIAAYYDGEFPWVSISDMTKGGKVLTCTDRNLSLAGLASSAAQMFPTGTVLYAMYASLGECSIAGIPLCTSQAILGIQPREALNGEYLYYYLSSLKSIVKTLGQQGTQANLNKGMVQSFQLQLPSIEEQTAIAAVLSDMDTDLTALENQRNKTIALKQGMMQELLTGRIRLV